VKWGATFSVRVDSAPLRGGDFKGMRVYRPMTLSDRRSQPKARIGGRLCLLPLATKQPYPQNKVQRSGATYI